MIINDMTLEGGSIRCPHCGAVQKICPECRRPFTPKRSDQVFCHVNCRNKKHRRK